MNELMRVLRSKLADDEGLLSPDTRRRIDAICGALEQRAVLTLQAWIGMLDSLETGLPHVGN